MVSESDRMQLLETLVREHHARLRAFVCSRTGDPDLSDDIVQEVFLIVYRKLDSLDLTGSLFPWLVTVARSQIRQRFRANAAEPDRIAVLAAERQAQMDDDEDTLSLLESRIERLRGCIARLKGKTRALIDLVYRDNQSCDAASVALGINCTAARVALHRARKLLRDCIEGASQGAQQ